jgi:hypothetical protein
MRTALPSAVAAIAAVAMATMARADEPAPPVQITDGSYAEHLIRAEAQAHPDALSLTIDAQPPGAASPKVVAATAGAATVGAVGGDADAAGAQVAASGKPQFLTDAAGGRATAVVPLQDVSGNPVGVLEASFPFKPGAEAAPRQAEAAAIAAELSHRIAHVRNLLDAWPFDPKLSDDTFAQSLVDRTLAAHPEIVILAVHATPPGSTTNVILGSNIGRIGKPADEDDLRVIQQGSENKEVNVDRFEAEVPLNDAAGHRIGALGVVFHYHVGDDKDALVRRAESIRDAMAAEIATPATLMGPAPPPPVRVAGHTDLQGYAGDFDHFAVDVAGGHLFLAGEDGGVLDEFDLSTGALVKSLPGFEAPHSLIFLPDTHELVVVADHGSRVLDAATLAERRPLSLTAGADSLAYDAARHRAYVVTGGKDVHMTTSALVEVDPYSGRTYGQTPLDGDHTEALAVEAGGARIFVNQTDKNLLDVVDKNTHAILARWPVTEAQQNAPIAYDEATHRLFVVTRAPGKLIVVNADTGATVQTFDAPGRIDQVLWDPAGRRIFACGGDGRLAVYEQDDADHYRPLPMVATPAAAKTGIYVPELHRLYLAASPGDTGGLAQLVWLDVDPRR